VSWAHAHTSWAPARARRWRQTVLDFAAALRTIGGVDADLDLWHTSEHENWSTFGVSRIRDSDFVLIAVSDAYRERWEETGSPTVGAGAAREANALKGLFDLDRSNFLNRVKVVLLPGAEVDAIPLELVSSAERFRIERFDLDGLSPLLRSLYGRPDFEKPPLGAVPPLPPSYVAEVTADSPMHESGAGAASLETTVGAFLNRLQTIDDVLSARGATLAIHERDALTTERSIIAGSLSALQTAARAAMQPKASVTAEIAEPDEVAEATDRARTAIADAREAMSVLPEIARETIFQYLRTKAPLTVGGEGDRFAIDVAIRAEEAGYINWVEDEDQMITPRAAHPRVGAALSALQDVRAVVFGGDSMTSRARAAPWAQLLLHDEYGIDDAEFELRPLWVQLGFLEE